jgi:phosphomannomutase/phosphoglucomutase
MITKRIFREYDLRGVVGVDFSNDFALLLGRAFALHLTKRNPAARTVSVGRDARLSSESLAESLIHGIVSTGIDVCDIGLCPTPLQYFSIHHLSLDGGVMVTGSHNPPEYNGFKLSIGKETIFGDEIQEIRRIIETGTGQGEGRGTGKDKGEGQDQDRGQVDSYDIRKAYREYMLKEFSYLADARFGRLRVVVDAGNGTGGIVAPDVLEAMGCEVIRLYCEPDGRFPNHHPDPTVIEYIKDLVRTTQEKKADIGIGYDGDADRIGVVNTDGRIIWGDQIMVILSRDILSRKPGSVIIGDVKCSQAMFDDIERNGGRAVMWKTGHSLVKDKMRKEGAVLAGEFSGHIFIGDDYFGFDDALYTTFRLVEIMKRAGKGLDELLSGLPQVRFTPEIRVECSDDEKKTLVERLVQRFNEYRLSGACPVPIRKVDNTDGVRVVFEKGWGLVRASNTQPVIVMRFEAEDEAILNDYRQFMEKEVQQAKGREKDRQR